MNTFDMLKNDFKQMTDNQIKQAKQLRVTIDNTTSMFEIFKAVKSITLTDPAIPDTLKLHLIKNNIMSVKFTEPVSGGSYLQLITLSHGSATCYSDSDLRKHLAITK